ncbi:hypothetical protein MKZ38_000014, partial [Zalerion maritima]
ERHERETRNLEFAPYVPPSPDQLPTDEPTLAGLPWGGMNMGYIIRAGNEVATSRRERSGGVSAADGIGGSGGGGGGGVGGSSPAVIFSTVAATGFETATTAAGRYLPGSTGTGAGAFGELGYAASADAGAGVEGEEYDDYDYDYEEYAGDRGQLELDGASSSGGGGGGGGGYYPVDSPGMEGYGGYHGSGGY